MTRFQERQTLVANTNAQGMKKGHRYIVTAVSSKPLGAFGELVTYRVCPELSYHIWYGARSKTSVFERDRASMWVRNLHVLASKVQAEAYHCHACGREELTCSDDPCAAVVRDRKGD